MSVIVAEHLIAHFKTCGWIVMQPEVTRMPPGVSLPDDHKEPPI
jgi:hypothetical protein